MSSDPHLDPAGGGEPTPCAYTEYREGRDVEDLPATGEDATGLEARVWDALYEVEDPEMPVSVVDLGLIYGVRVEQAPVAGERTPTANDGEQATNEDGASAGNEAGDRVASDEADAGTRVAVDMTLTYSGCPARKMLTAEIEDAVAAVDGVTGVDLRLVWSPEWSLEMVTDCGREHLREFGLSV